MCELNQADYARCLDEGCNAMVLPEECSNPGVPLCPRHDHSEYNRIFADLLKPRRRVRQGSPPPNQFWR